MLPGYFVEHWKTTRSHAQCDWFNDADAARKATTDYLKQGEGVHVYGVVRFYRAEQGQDSGKLEVWMLEPQFREMMYKEIQAQQPPWGSSTGRPPGEGKLTEGSPEKAAQIALLKVDPQPMRPLNTGARRKATP
jgi:hypothetical protein